MELPYYICKSRKQTSVAVVLFSLTIIVFYLFGFGVIPSEGASSREFMLLFTTFFGVPCVLYVYKVHKNNKYMMRLDSLGVVFFHLLCKREIAINKEQIIDVSTEWQGPRSESSMELIFTVTPETLANYKRNTILPLQKNRLYFDFSLAELDPWQGVELLKEYLGKK